MEDSLEEGEVADRYTDLLIKRSVMSFARNMTQAVVVGEKEPEKITIATQKDGDMRIEIPGFETAITKVIINKKRQYPMLLFWVELLFFLVY